MKLISYLQEAADTPLADLRALVKKDKRVNKIFSKKLQLDELDNPKEFVQTLRFYVLNNRHVLEFIKHRSGVSKHVSAWWFKTSRELRPEQLNQSVLETLQQNVLDFFRDLTSVTNATISNDTFSSLWGWLKKMKGHRSGLGSGAIAELKSIPAIRPTTATRLYHGLLFDADALVERNRGGGMLDIGSGLKFLRSVREGSRVADVVYDAPSVWYRDKEQAISVAFHGDLGGLRDNRNKIAGELAFVISVLAQPEDIIVDTALIPKVEHAEPVVVLDAGKHTVRVVHKYTSQGEVDPTEKPAEESDLVQTLEGLEMFAHIFKLPYEPPVFTSIDHGGWDQERIEQVRQLAAPGASTKIAKAFNILLQYFNTYIKHITPDQANALAADHRYGKAAQVLKELGEYMAEKTQHPTKKDPEYRAARGLWMPRAEMTGEELLASSDSSSMRELLPFIADPIKNKRFTRWNVGSIVNSLRRMNGLAYVKDLHREAGAVQQKYVEEAVDSFFDAINEQRPADKAEAAKKMNSITAVIEKNAQVLTQLWSIRSALDRLKD